MTFKVGDSVAVIDDNLEGIVTAVSGDTVTIEDSHGFPIDFKSDEIVKVNTPQSQLSSINIPLSKILEDKEQNIKKPSKRTKPKHRNKPALEVDLHMHKLVASERGMTAYDKLNLQLDTVRGQLEFAMRKNIQKVVFIHGVGQGVLRQELETLLRRYDNLKFYDADFKTYGVGATEVYIFQNP